MSLTDDQLAHRLVTGLTRPGSARTTPGLYRTLLRLLAVADLARAAGHHEGEVRTAIASWADTEYDEAGHIVGYGLTLRPTPHSFTVDDHQLYAWCALDTLFFPTVIGRPAQVESPCQATGAPVRLTVDPTTGVTDLDPATAVVSVVTVKEDCGSIRTAFCRQVHFFAHHDAATARLTGQPDTTILPVADAYRLAQPLADALLDNGTPDGCCPSVTTAATRSRTAR
jgi:alkylmercury lyase